MRRILPLLLIAATALGEGNAPINYGTQTHVVKKPPTTTFTACDFDFSGLNVCGLAGTGTITSITAVAPIIVTPDPIVSTGTISFSPTPPPSGTYVLGSVNGVIQWLATTVCSTPTPTPTPTP